MKNNKSGITLIALVITIVVLIILAAVAINLSLGNNGIFNRAQTAKEQYVNSQDYENKIITQTEGEIDGYVDGNRGTVTLTEEQYNKLVNKEWTLITDFTTCSETNIKNINLDGYTEIEIRIENTTYNWTWDKRIVNISELSDTTTKCQWLSFVCTGSNYVSARVALTKTTAAWAQYSNSNSIINRVSIYAR